MVLKIPKLEAQVIEKMVREARFPKTIVAASITRSTTKNAA